MSENFFSEACLVSARILCGGQGGQVRFREKGLLRFLTSQLRTCPNKKGAGANHRPRMDSRFAMSDTYHWLPTATACYITLTLRRQNFATLGAAAGENFTAIGSSHSLAETVDLGSVATAGLIGTLHSEYTSCQFTYARQLDSCSET